MLRYDVIVVGLGAMGSATVCALASRGHAVLGLDRYSSPHAMGSSHGKTRIIREAYFEDPLYVPLVQRAYECWAELERRSGVALFTRTGGLMLGPPSSALVSGARRSALQHRLPHEILSADDVQRRFPAFAPGRGMIGVWEPNAGVLQPELAISAALGVATACGADIHMNEAMQSWRSVADGVEVTTAMGVYRARRLVLAVGAWVADALPHLGLPVRVQRNVLYWFAPLHRADQFTDTHFPIFLCEYAPDRWWYGFPDSGDGVKVALHLNGEYTHPDALRRDVADGEVAVMRELLARFLPNANGALRHATACMYTNTTDGHFIIDAHPAHANVIVASPCSGHGFKFASVLGEVLADLATGRVPAFDLHPFRLSRFGTA